MRRPPEVGQAGLLVVLLLGLSGCAGFPQRTGGSSPWPNSADGQSVTPPGLFSWWHRASAQPTAEATSADVQTDSARPVQRETVASQSSSSPWPETQAEWTARNFPRLTRLWNGTPTEAPGNRDHLAATRTQPNPPADDATRSARESEDLVTSPSDPTDGARRTSFQPDADSAEPQQNTGRPAAPKADDDAAATQPRQLTDIVPAPVLEQPQESVGTNRSNAAATQAATPSDTASDHVPAPTFGARLAQVPPAPPPSQGTPPAPAPAPATGNRPASTPPEPPAPPATDQPATPMPTPAPPASTTPAYAPSPAQTSQTAPAPLSVHAQAQRPLAASGQSPYASLTQTEQTQPRHHLLSWLFHDEDDDRAPLPSSQLPPAAFPTTYTSPQNALATGQGTTCAPDGTCKPPKKPCFLKVWIHDLKQGHGSDADCGHGGVCASAQGNATPCETTKPPKKPCFLKVWMHDLKNGGKCPGGDGCTQQVTASPQAPTVCETAAKAPKKPCFLKVWIHDFKSGHGSGCGSCKTGGGSCSNSCKCCGGSGGQSPALATAQGGGIATAQGAPEPAFTRP